MRDESITQRHSPFLGGVWRPIFAVGGELLPDFAHSIIGTVFFISAERGSDHKSNPCHRSGLHPHPVPLLSPDLPSSPTSTCMAAQNIQYNDTLCWIPGIRCEFHTYISSTNLHASAIFPPVEATTAIARAPIQWHRCPSSYPSLQQLRRSHPKLDRSALPAPIWLSPTAKVTFPPSWRPWSLEIWRRGHRSAPTTMFQR